MSRVFRTSTANSPIFNSASAKMTNIAIINQVRNKLTSGGPTLTNPGRSPVRTRARVRVVLGALSCAPRWVDALVCGEMRPSLLPPRPAVAPARRPAQVGPARERRPETIKGFVSRRGGAVSRGHVVGSGGGSSSGVPCTRRGCACANPGELSTGTLRAGLPLLPDHL